MEKSIKKKFIFKKEKIYFLLLPFLLIVAFILQFMAKIQDLYDRDTKRDERFAIIFYILFLLLLFIQPLITIFFHNYFWPDDVGRMKAYLNNISISYFLLHAYIQWPCPGLLFLFLMIHLYKQTLELTQFLTV
jgi:hypothetical protein